MALVTDWAQEKQSLGIWQKHFDCKGPITIVCCRSGWRIVFMSSRINNDAQSRYSPIEGEALTVYWATSKGDYFIYGCDKLYIGLDIKPLLAFFRKVDPKPLHHILNKRLRKNVSEINAIRFTIFRNSGAKNYLSDQGFQFPSGGAGDDKEESPKSTRNPNRAVSDKGTLNQASSLDFQEYTWLNACPLMPTICPLIARSLLGFFPTEHLVQPLMWTI